VVAQRPMEGLPHRVVGTVHDTADQMGPRQQRISGLLYAIPVQDGRKFRASTGQSGSRSMSMERHLG